MSKVPCGGFKLDNNFLGMNKNGELSLASGSEGEAYKQLVTDRDGNVKWEDRLAYGWNRIRVTIPEAEDMPEYIKVSDDFPTGSYDIGARVYTIDSDGERYERTIGVSNGEVITDNIYEPNVIVALHDNVTFLSDDGLSITLPEKGTYFAKYKNYYITGVVLGDGYKPEITWDGNIDIVKKIDSKFIPSNLNEIILPSSTSGSSKKFKITVNDNGAISATEITT